MASPEPPLLRQFDCSPVFGWRPPLGVQGAKVYLQTKAKVVSSRPSRISRALERPLPLPNSISHDDNLNCSHLEIVQQQETATTRKKVTSKKLLPPKTKADRKQCIAEDGGHSTTGTGDRIVSVALQKKYSVRSRLPQQVRRLDSGTHAGGGIQKTAAATSRLVRRRRVNLTTVLASRGGVHEHRRVQKKFKTQTRKRQLHLLCKYSAVWSRRVFGRLLPSVARRHHRRRLLKQSFGKWNHQWWSARREWKLNIRAECHDRYRLWMVVWRKWTEFVITRRQRKAVKKSASTHNDSRLKRRAWSGWRDYLSERREKIASQESAKQWHVTRVLRYGWMMWRDSLQTKRGSDVLWFTALHHWATRLQTKVWRHWKERYQENVVQRVKSAVAERHWVVRQQAGCWTAWAMYVERRRRKKHLNGMAVKRCCSSLLEAHFALWQHRLQRSRQLAEFQQLVTERGERAVERRALARWRHYMELVLYGRHLLQVATLHYHTSLKHKAVVCLRSYTERQKVQSIRKSAARQFRECKMLRHGWQVWLQRCEHCEEIKMLPLTRKARHHFRQCSLKRVLPGWKAFVVLRQQQKTKMALADQHFKSHALPQCFAALQQYMSFRHYKRELHGHAQSFRRENLLSMVFYTWWRACHHSQELHTLERVAILHNEEVVKRSTLRLWRVRTRGRVQQLACEHSAVAQHCRRLLSTTLHRWRDHRQARVVAQQQAECAVNHHIKTSLRRMWTAWKQYVEHRRESKARRARGVGHYQSALLHKAWKGWQSYHYCAVRKKAKKNRAHQFYSVILERHVLWQWWENVQHNQLQREMIRTALTHFQKATFHKYFIVWRGRTIQSLENAQRENERVQEITSLLRRAKMVRLLTCWREYTNSCIVRRIAYDRAIVHSNRHLLRNCLTAWLKYHQLALRKMLLSRQCARFERSRLVLTYYAKWRMELMSAVAMKRKSVLALWQWSQSLQRRALVCWLLYTMNRKRKAERYAQALHRHRSRLVRIGVTQWIKFATSVKSQRVESSLQHHAEVAQHTMQCVRRCARRWRAAARKRKTAHHNTLTKKLTKKQPFTLDPPHTEVVEPRTERKIGEDIWANIARQHHILDGPVPRRSQPRQSNYLRSLSRDALLLQDITPRLDAPQPLTPPVPYRQQQRPGEHGDGLATTHSFTFLPSTSSEFTTREQKRPTTTTTHQCGLHNTAPRPSMLPTRPAALKTTRLHVVPKPHPVPLLPPSAFEKPRPLRASPQLSIDLSSPPEPVREKGVEALGECAASGPMGVLAGERTAVASLSDPAIRSHIIHVRDELRKYHEMKTKQRTLEQQVALGGENGDGHLAEFQVELSRVTESLRRTEPVILEMVAQVQRLFTENQPLT